MAYAYLTILIVTATTLLALLVRGFHASNGSEPASGLDPNAFNDPSHNAVYLHPFQLRRLRRDTGGSQPQPAAPAHAGGQQPTRNGEKPHFGKRLLTKLRHLLGLKKHFTRLWASLKKRFSKKRREVKTLVKRAGDGDAEARKDLAEVKQELKELKSQMKAAETKAAAAETKATAAETKAAAAEARATAAEAKAATAKQAKAKVAPAAPPKLSASTPVYKPVISSMVENTFGGGIVW